MSSISEFIQNWNEIFQDNKIKESDLYQPNEKFLTSVLLHYLEKFNFNIELLKNARDNGNQENRRIFKIQLCGYIDYLYKSSDDASNSFLYYDLIMPTQKKTVHLLKYLLNYLLFYNLMKEEVLEPTENLIRERSELLDKKSKLLIENEKNQDRAQNIEKSIKKCRNTLTDLNEKLSDLEIKVLDQNNMKKRIEATNENYNTRLIDLKKEEHSLKRDIISEEENENILNKKSNLQKLLTEQTEIKESIITSYRETTNNIDQLEPFNKKLENILSIIQLEDVTKFKQLKQIHDELFEKVKQQTLMNNETISLTEKDMKMIEKLNILINTKNDDIEKWKELSNETVFNMQKKYETEELKNVNVDSVLNEVNDQLKEQKEMTDIMNKSTDKLIKHLTDGDPTTSSMI